MTTFDEMYYSKSNGSKINYNGGELTKYRKSGKCSICKEVYTNFIDDDLGLYVCSPECEDKAWQDIYGKFSEW